MKDAMTAYVSVRRLGDLLAAQGFPTLRFDYPGTGDSCDPEFEGGHWAVWQRSIDQAADWLRATTGARRIVLCGFRIGATLAALAAARRGDVAGLVLIEPVLEGRSYVRQLALEAELLHGWPPAKDEVLQLHELQLPPASVADIAAVDLRQLALPAGLKVAVFCPKRVEAAGGVRTGLAGLRHRCRPARLGGPRAAARRQADRRGSAGRFRQCAALAAGRCSCPGDHGGGGSSPRPPSCIRPASPKRRLISDRRETCSAFSAVPTARRPTAS